MSKKNLMGFVAKSALVLGIVFSSSSAYAGFQWVAPEAASSQPSMNNYQPPQAAMSAPEVISPVIISGSAAPASYPPNTPYAPPAYVPPAPTQMQQPQTYAPQPSAATPFVQTPPRPNLATATVAMPSGGDIVQGFASQVPLTLALRQILPTGYNFSIDQNVDTGTSVSYQGGKSWRDTVNTMLASVNLSGREQGSTIVVSKSGMQQPAPAMTDFSASDTIPISSSPALAQSPPSTGSAPMLMMAHSDVPSFNVNSADGWSAEHGDTLHKVLTAWCARQGVELQWLAEYDYPVEASAHFSGSFEDAVRNLLAGFETARPQPIGELHSNPGAGQMVLVVSPRGNSYSN